MKRLTPAWLAVSLACCFSAGTLAADALQTKAFSNMPADFIKGADISTLLDAEKLGLGLTAFVLIKTQHHSSDWYCHFVSEVTQMAEVLGFWRMAGEYDYLLRVQVADMKRYDDFYKRLVNSVPGLSDVTSSFAMEQIKYTTALPVE